MKISQISPARNSVANGVSSVIVWRIVCSHLVAVLIVGTFVRAPIMVRRGLLHPAHDGPERLVIRYEIRDCIHDMWPSGAKDMRREQFENAKAWALLESYGHCYYVPITRVWYLKQLACHLRARAPTLKNCRTLCEAVGTLGREPIDSLENRSWETYFSELNQNLSGKE